MPSPTDFNQSPYYDDFTESKKFHRILFRPAFAVQARELTQSQSILQNQVERVSDHLFDKGAMIIPGQVAWDTDYQAVKLTSFTGSSTLSDFESVEVTGGTSGVVGTIVNSVVTDGTDPNTLFIRYTKTGTDNAAKTFTDGETITGTTAASVALSAVVETTATGSAAKIESGVYYINGFHVQVDEQTLILDKYTNTPSYRVGLTVTESFETPNDDTSLNDNAQGSSNENAPGAHRHKIVLTLAKKSLTATDDSNFIELLRTKTGTLQQKVNTTAYNVLENTFARRTFDESGDYAISGLDLDVREHLLSGTNRGVYASGETSADGNTASSTLLALGVGPGKAYVKGYEVQNIGTTYVDVDKPRTFDTQSGFGTNFEVENYVNVTNVYGTPDVGFVSGDSEAFKSISLHDTASSSRGTAQTASGGTVPLIGRAKSRGFEYSSGTQSADIMSSSSLTDSIYKHYIFDVEMFFHLNIVTATSFTVGETVTGATSGGTGVVVSSSTKDASITSITTASPGVATSSSHTFKDGQQVTIHGTSNLQIDSSVVAEDQVFTVRNPTTNTFELYDGTLGTTAQNVTAYVSGAVASHGVVVLSNIQGTFFNNETVTGGTSSATAVTQISVLSSKGALQRAFHEVKQISMSGSPVYTADTATSTTTLGDIVNLVGTISVANSGTTVSGFGSIFQNELKIGDRIAFTTNAGTALTRIVESILSDTVLEVTTAVGGSDVTTKAPTTRQRTKIQGGENNVAISVLPYLAIKTLKTADNSNISDTSFKVRRHFTGTLSSSGTLSITAGTNETFSASAEGDYTVSIMSTGSGSTGAVGDVLSIDGNNHEAAAIFTLGGSPTGVTLTFDYGANFAAHKVKILATVSRTTVASKTKTLNAATTLTETTQATIESGVVGLGKADIYALNSVYMSPAFGTTPTTSHTDITTRFELDKGQRDNFYDIGRIKLKPGKKTPTGQLLINFDYFSHGSGDFFDVDSYSGVIDYVDIPFYIGSVDNTTYHLRDCLDFRPRVDDASTIESGAVDRSFDGTGASTVDPVKFKSDVTTDHEYYIPRIDKIYYTKEGNIKAIQGAPSLIPKAPGEMDNAMLLYTVNYPPYGVQTSDVSVQKQDNRRYTMRDIGAIERRLDNVEYYTQLSLLEQDALGLQIQDANGMDRFKNGFLVDNFSSHRVGDVGNPNYKCSIDMARGNLRPMFNEDNINLVESTSALSTSVTDTIRAAQTYKKTGDLLTLPYTEVVQIEQPFATKTVNVNPFNVLVWAGTVELDPPSDEWKETERRPEVTIDNIGAFDTLTQDIPNAELEGVEIGTMFGDWEQFWAGQETQQLGQVREGGNWGMIGNGFGWIEGGINNRIGTFNTTAETRTNVRNTIVSQTVRNTIGDRIVSVGFIPFIRSRDVTFSGTRMKPNIRVYPFFDEVDVSAYCTPTSGSLGGNIVTDAGGACSGTFAIPDPTNDDNPRWRTGERVFRLTSSSSNSSTNVETSGEADYVARGLIETVQETIISTREPRLVREAVTEERRRRELIALRDEGARRIDPIAQTFLHEEDDGIFITSMDCFFSAKDSTIPIALQIREVVNGYPGGRVLPFGEVVLNPSSVNTSTDGTTATTFTFPSPIYLEGSVEYCVVLLANSDKYLAYVARMGETVVDGTRMVSTQPSLGSFFKSQNASTWTAEQNEDLKFTLRRAEFTTGGTVYLVNDTLPSRTLATNPITTTDGSDTLTINHRNHGMHSTSDNVTIAGLASGTYNGLAHSAINGTYTSISNITHDSYDITLADSTAATSTGDVGGSTVTATQNRQMDTAFLMLQQLLIPGTNVTHNMRTTSGKSLHGTQAQFSLASTDNKVAVVAGRNLFFTSPQMVVSEINETNEMSGSKSFVLIMTMTTNNDKISPVLDLARSSLVAVSNRLNSPTASNTTDFVAETAATGNSSSAQYITRTATLATVATAFDIRIDANVRGSSEMEVYFRTTGPEDDSRTINTVSWTAFNTDGAEDNLITPAEDDATFSEYQYTVSNLPSFTAFQLKIVMKGTNSAYPPVIRDLRCIALAV